MIRHGVKLKKRHPCGSLAIKEGRPHCTSGNRNKIHRYSPCELWHGGFKKPFPYLSGNRHVKDHVLMYKDRRPTCYTGLQELDQILGLKE